MHIHVDIFVFVFILLLPSIQPFIWPFVHKIRQLKFTHSIWYYLCPIRCTSVCKSLEKRFQFYTLLLLSFQRNLLMYANFLIIENLLALFICVCLGTHYLLLWPLYCVCNNKSICGLVRWLYWTPECRLWRLLA